VELVLADVVAVNEDIETSNNGAIVISSQAARLKLRMSYFLTCKLDFAISSELRKRDTSVDAAI